MTLKNKPGKLGSDTEQEERIDSILSNKHIGNSQINLIPNEIKKLPQWLVWKSVPTTDPSKKPRKIPINVKTGNGGSSTSPQVWTGYEEAQVYYGKWKGQKHTHADASGVALTGEVNGLGFAFTKDDPFTGIDLDNCRDPETGIIAPWAMKIIEELDSYTEVSPSGTGVHTILKGKKPDGYGSKRGDVECYDTGRYFTVTGDAIDGYETITPRQHELEQFLDEHLSRPAARPLKGKKPVGLPGLGVDAPMVLERALRSKQGEKIRALYAGDNGELSSDSEGDLSLVNSLCFFCGHVSDEQTAEAVETIIRESGRYRPKWDEMHRPADGATYGDMTIEKAIAGTKNRFMTGAERRLKEARELEKFIEENGLSLNEIIGSAYHGQRGCSELVIKTFKNKFCFDHSCGHWHGFKGHSWKIDKTGKFIASLDRVQFIYKWASAKIAGEIVLIGQEMKETTDTLSKADLEQKNKKLSQQEKVLSKIIASLDNLTNRKQVAEFAAQGPDSLGMAGDQWDLQPWCLPCGNGVIDLKTGELLAGQPEQYLKSVCPTNYMPDLSCPQWEAALQGIFDGDQDLIDYFQRVIGMTLIGENIEHVMLVLWGAGRNGKDTLLEACKNVLGGNLAGAIQSEVLLDQGRVKNSSGPSPDIMRLRGLRMAWASETNEGRRLDSGKIKLITGGGQLVGRPPYGRYEVSFPQSFTLFLLTNSKPHAQADDFALWKRMKLIPFKVKFVADPKEPDERKIDKHLWEKLRGEAEGILAWMVGGCLDWQRQGLNTPAAVEQATEDYRNEEDLLLQFVEECCSTGPDLSVLGKDFYSRYREWMQTSGLKSMSNTLFGRKMSIRFHKMRRTEGVLYKGVGIVVPADKF